MTDPLKLRKEIKSRKPDFMKQDAHKKARLSKSWRKPRGRQSKMRLNTRGYRRGVALGYGSPAVVKGAHPTGFMPVMTHNVEELSSIDAVKEGIIIASSVGKRKKIDIIKKALEMKISVLNLKDPAKFVANIEAALDTKRKAKKVKTKKRQNKKKEYEKQAADKKAQETKKEENPEVQEQQEKKEKDKVLTKKEM